MKVSRIALIAMIFSTMSFADTLRMEKNLEGEHLPINKVWAEKTLKSGEKTCKSWAKVCQGTECRSCAVTYLVGKEREKRKLTWDAKTQRWLGYDGKAYDTATENTKHKVEPSTRYEFEALKSWGITPGIWVLDTNGQLYTSVEQSPGKFHHSSFLAGGLVEGAGQVVFVKGKITRINNSSGHYKPDRASFREALKKLHLPANAGDDSDTSGLVEYDNHSIFKSKTNIRSSNDPDTDDEGTGYSSNLDYYDHPADEAIKD